MGNFLLFVRKVSENTEQKQLTGTPNYPREKTQVTLTTAPPNISTLTTKIDSPTL
jgi:hypothetical protein